MFYEIMIAQEVLSAAAQQLSRVLQYYSQILIRLFVMPEDCHRTSIFMELDSRRSLSRVYWDVNDD